MNVRFRRGVSAFCAALLALAVAVGPIPGSSHAKEPSKKKGPIRVAILPIVNATQELGAVKIMDDILREQLAEVPKERASFLFPFDTEQILGARNQLDRAYRLTEKWSKYGTLDSAAVAGLDSIMMVDAVLMAKISEWENHRVPVIGAGSSHTTVAFSFACYDVRSKKRIWKKEPREQRFGQEIDPTSGTVNYDETGFIQNKRATDPPRYEAVASDLVRSAFKKFPQK